ncbi:hypothetical protein NDU88_004846 [Pleurodeles waltl]|uniref:Uncharacterized protein n=1 Tax=Pleurodeles waltl TaxID=8319 RepID=A0AAV7WAA2_PLEWA|nr:hypothetical protein NDU88_004846 [Pleurodeles waltl]
MTSSTGPLKPLTGAWPRWRRERTRWSELRRLGPGFASRPRSGGPVRLRQEAWSCGALVARALKAPVADRRGARGRVCWAGVRVWWMQWSTARAGRRAWRLARRQRGCGGALNGSRGSLVRRA